VWRDTVRLINLQIASKTNSLVRYIERVQTCVWELKRVSKIRQELLRKRTFLRKPIRPGEHCPLKSRTRYFVEERAKTLRSKWSKKKEERISLRKSLCYRNVPWRPAKSHWKSLIRRRIFARKIIPGRESCQPPGCAEGSQENVTNRSSLTTFAWCPRAPLNLAPRWHYPSFSYFPPEVWKSSG